MAEQSFNVDPHASAPTLEQSAAKVDAEAAARAAAEGDTTPSRPDWLPEQFTSVAEYTKSAAETRAALTKAQQELAELKKGQQPPAETKPATTTASTEQTPQTEADKAAAAAATKAGVDLTPFNTEFSEKGDVSEESRAKLAESLKGVLGDNARALVDQYVEGSKATVTNHHNAIFGEAGGKDGYGELVRWASTGLPKAEVEAYNKAMDSDPNTALLAVRNLKNAYEKANGRAPRLVQGDTSLGGALQGVQPFASAFEQNKAVQDPKYSKDPAYRASVISRMLVSKF